MRPSTTHSWNPNPNYNPSPNLDPNPAPAPTPTPNPNPHPNPNPLQEEFKETHKTSEKFKSQLISPTEIKKVRSE